MDNQVIMIFIAVGILIAVLVIIPSSENFGSRVTYTAGGAESSVNCEQNPDAPACQPLPDVDPTAKDLASCTPSNGQWSIPGAGVGGRSKLNSPCCQPPSYELGKDKPYKTCDDALDTSDPIQRCVANCCANADSEANNYDPSWYPMARCACSMWCYNQQVPHFKKYGTAVHYITGDLAEAKTSDDGSFIGGGNFSGA